jgi:hypothetical protein
VKFGASRKPTEKEGLYKKVRDLGKKKFRTKKISGEKKISQKTTH